MSKRPKQIPTLQSFLQTYRDTPHSATGIEPGNMIFRDGYQSNFPRKSYSSEEVSKANLRDSLNKEARKDEYNSSRHTRAAQFRIGDQVLVRNFSKQTKFEPYFLPERYIVSDTLAQGKIILVQSSRTGRYLKRHPNDLKLYEGEFSNDKNGEIAESDLLQAWREAFETIDNVYDNDYFEYTPNIPGEDQNVVLPRRSERVAVQNPRYYNNDFVN